MYCDKLTHSGEGCTVWRPWRIDNQQVFPSTLLERCVRCTLVEHLKTFKTGFYLSWLPVSTSEREGATCTNPPFAAFTHSALNTLVIVTAGGTDKLLISASPLLLQDKLATAVLRSFEWILANNSGRLPFPVTQGSLCTVYLFIYLLFLSLDKTDRNRTDWNLLSLEEVINAKQ